MPTPSVTASSAQLFDERDIQRLTEVYAPCLTVIVHLRETDDYGEPAALRQRIKELFDHAEREAGQLGVATEDVAHAKFALVAFLDETILSSDWVYRDQWLARPLQLELYDRYDAGEVFFDRLQQFLDEPMRHAEVLEVYYLCMTLGFKGKYQLHDQARLRILIDDTKRALDQVPGLGALPLAPHGRPRGQVASEVRRKFPTWLLVAAACALALIVYLGLYLYMGNASGEVAQQIEVIRQGQGLGR
jgi:type VI secretion system protein ImpK